jgi:uncharacterized membrane protein
MRTRTVRLAILPLQGFLVYLVCANTLAETGVVGLPLSYGVIGGLWFGIQMTLIILQLVVVLVLSVFIKRLGSTLPATKTA